MKLNIFNVERVSVEGLRGGEGTVYLQKLPTLVDMKMYSLITIPKGSSIGVHTHTVDEEMIIVYQGSGKLIIDGIEHDFNVGDVSLCKKGRNHSIRNDNDEDLIVLAVVNE